MKGMMECPRGIWEARHPASQSYLRAVQVWRVATGTSEWNPHQSVPLVIEGDIL